MDRIYTLLMALLALLFLTHINSVNASTSLTEPTCSQTMSRKRNIIYRLSCSNLNTLQKHLNRARANTTEVVIEDSNIPLVPGHSFIRFSLTLETIDMHLCGIEMIDPQTFVGLTKLKKLILWGNKLIFVPSVWFEYLGNLQLLDLSFNSIQDIDQLVYYKLPNLEYFYIDYNQLKTIPFTLFANFQKLKKVRFGMNNWNWAFRVYLTWQLVAQKVDFDDDWENWDWMSNSIRECVESGQGSIPNDEVLDCVTMKLVEMASDQLSDSRNRTLSISTPCVYEASHLLRCTNKSKPGNKARVTRQTLQGISSIFKRMSFSRGIFSTL